MIYCYTGTPGSGKSLHAAKEIMVQDKRNLPSLINFQVDSAFLNHPGNVYLPDVNFTPEMLIQFSLWYHAMNNIQRPVEGSLLLVIDEAQTVFNARSWNENGRKEWIHFFSQHRKYGYDVILITQYLEMLDKQIRALIEYNVVHRSMSNFRGGFLFKSLLRLFMGTFQVSVYWLHTKLKVSSYRVWNYKKCFPLYDTFHIFTEGAIAESEKDVVEIERGKRNSVTSRLARPRNAAQPR